MVVRHEGRQSTVCVTLFELSAGESRTYKDEMIIEPNVYYYVKVGECYNGLHIRTTKLPKGYDTLWIIVNFLTKSTHSLLVAMTFLEINWCNYICER